MNDIVESNAINAFNSSCEKRCVNLCDGSLLKENNVSTLTSDP